CDIEMDLGKRVLPYKAPETGRKVAIIGGGVEGLSTAFFTARLGHEPTLFEATSTLGGLLRVAISEDRLSQDVLDWDIEGILEMGVNVKMGVKAGEDFTVASLLKSGYEAVFTSTGGWDSRLSRGEISHISNIFPGGYLMIDLLRNDVQKSKRIPCGRDVVIVGGGSLALDAINMCQDRGAKNITLIVRKAADMKSFDDKTLEAIKVSGAVIVYESGVTKLIGQDDKLCQIEYTNLGTGQKSTIDAQTIILGSGRFPEVVFIKREEAIPQEGAQQEDLAKNQPLYWEGVETYKTPSNNKELGFLSPEDELSGYSAAVIAINGGRRAAATIHKLMYGLPINDVQKPVAKRSILQGVSCVENVQITSRNILPTYSALQSDGSLNSGVSIRRGNEIFGGYTSEVAKHEAERCLKCGLICYERAEQQTTSEPISSSATTSVVLSEAELPVAQQTKRRWYLLPGMD
ncbi:MAG: FAD-dependent oxidoreductase, partial [Desulfamplus sp.]|nr:FAD-dependent oxidoreductase [Desulfamplus sp.]